MILGVFRGIYSIESLRADRSFCRVHHHSNRLEVELDELEEHTSLWQHRRWTSMDK